MHLPTHSLFLPMASRISYIVSSLLWHHLVLLLYLAALSRRRRD